jgi:RNA-binding motif protein, X-linked 2
MPRDKETGKSRGFGFLMYEDQRSTVLAVDNLNGAKVLDKTLRVDHVKSYKQPGTKGENGEWVEADEQRFNAKPQLIGTYLMCVLFLSRANCKADDGAEFDSSVSSGPPIDPEDPMAEYLIAQRKEEKAFKKSKKSKSKAKHKDETPEERRARKARKKEKKAKKLLGKSEGMRGVEDLLASLGGRDRNVGPSRSERIRSRSRTPVRRRSSRSPVRGRSTRSQSHRSHSRSGSPRDYEMRGPSRPYERDGRDYDRPSGRDSRSRRDGRDYD